MTTGDSIQECAAIGPSGVPVAFKTLGCKVNRVESDQIAAELIGCGAVLAQPDEAAVIVVNTCTVTGEADTKARKAVRQALKGARSPLVVVTGCLAALDTKGLAEISERVIVEVDKGKVAARVASALGVDELAHTGIATVAMGEGFRTRASIKIEDGCDNFCSYCIVPYARGVPQAVPLHVVRDQAEALVAHGAKEIVLTGINIGRYQDAGASLAEVVRAVSETGIARIRLSSIEPPDLTPDLLGVLAETPAFCEHLHVPLQSGSDAVLRSMGRTYSTREFASRIEEARAAIPGLAVTTDLIAGFPGESDADHHATAEFVEATAFAKIHVFRYSERPGTPAAAMAQLDPRVRARRAADLREVGERLREDYLASISGPPAEVLVERIDSGRARGTTRDYVHVAFQAALGVCAGDLIEVDLSTAECS